MFYKIIFSEDVVKRRQRWLLIRHSIVSGTLGFGMLLIIQSYVPADMTIYSLSREYAELYRELLPRDIVLASGLPIAMEFAWTGHSRNQECQAFLDALAGDLQKMDASRSGTIHYSSLDTVLHFEGDLDAGGFPLVYRLFTVKTANLENELENGELDEDVKNDPLVRAYLGGKPTALTESAQAQSRFLNKQMKEFNDELWQTEGAVLGQKFRALKSGGRSDFFLIDPYSTLRLLGSDKQSGYKAKAAEWKKKADIRFSLKRRVNNELYERVCALRTLEAEIPLKQATQPLFGRVEWLLNAATNFLTPDGIKSGQVEKRVVEVADWAGFNRSPIVVVGGLTNENALFPQAKLLITAPDQTSLTFSQYADFYKCLVNEPERFQIESVSDLTIEIRSGVAFVKSFEIQGEVVGANPKKLLDYLNRVREVNLCLDDLRKVGELLPEPERTGASHGR